MGKDTPGKTTAIISYLTIIGCLIAVTRNMEPKHDFARLHTRQAFGIHLIYHSLAVYLNLTNVSNIFFWSTLWIIYAMALLFGLFCALNSRKDLLPTVGTYFQKWFTFIP